MKIAVLIGLASHRQSGKQIASDLSVCSLAREFAQQQRNSSISWIHFGEKSQALEEYLGYGIDTIHCHRAHQEFNADDAAGLLREYDLIILGNKATGGFASGMLGYLLAHQLDRPIHANIVSLHKQVAQQFLPSGYRREIAIQFPAVITVHQKASNTLRFSYSNQQAGRIIEHTDNPLAARPSTGDGWQIQPVSQQRTRLRLATTDISAQQRMQQAVSATSGSTGTVNRLSSEDAAQEIWDILRQQRLVE